MKTGDGFGNTWLTNWRLADAAPKRTLLLTFFGTALGVALGDYFISRGRESVWLRRRRDRVRPHRCDPRVSENEDLRTH